MNDNIICPHCKKAFPVTEALKHQLREDIAKVFELEQKQIMWKKALAAAEKRTKEKNTLEIKMLKEENEEKEKKLTELRQNELEIRKERVKLEEEKKELELKTQRTIDEERKKFPKNLIKKRLKKIV